MGTPARMVCKISKEASYETGFSEGMPIAIGGGDQQCTAIGAGIIREGMAVVILGTGGAIIAHIDSRKKDEQHKVVIGGACIPGKWDMEGLQATASGTLKWWQENFAQPENKAAIDLGLDVFEIIDLEASKSPPCSKGLIFFPFFQGQCTPNYDDYAKGGFLGISFAHDKKDMMRAIMEGTVFEINMIKKAMEDVLGKEFYSLRISGGGAKSYLWNQIQADIYGKPVERPEVSECANLGAAILGAFGCNYFNSIEEGVDQMVNLAQVIEPIKKNHKLYKNAYDIFEKAFNSLSKNNINKELAEFQKEF
jgi:xylulokinase